MANVLSVLEQASDEEIRNQVAAFEVMTAWNIMSTEGVKVADKAAVMVNRVGRLLGAKKQLLKDLKPMSIEEQIQERIEELADADRDVLETELRRLLAERLVLEEESSDERLAKELVNLAAEYMDIEEVLAPAEKTDEVYKRYQEYLAKKAAPPAFPLLGMWQQMKDISNADGEVCCQLIFKARKIWGRTFAPEDDDLPDWLVGRDEETRQKIEESDDFYRERQEILQEAGAALREAERKLQEAQARVEAVRAEEENLKRHLAHVQTQVENYDSFRLENEIQLGVLEGQLIAAASAKKQSSLTINKLKKQVLKQRERIAALKAEHERNLETLENAPAREEELRQQIAEAEADSECELADCKEAQLSYEEAKAARDEARNQRKENLQQHLEEWLEQEYGGSAHKLDEVVLNQLAISDNELAKAVIKAMKQLLDAQSPQDLGDRAEDGSLQLPIVGTEMFLVYEADDEGEITFLKYTDEENLAELAQ